MPSQNLAAELNVVLCFDAPLIHLSATYHFALFMNLIIIRNALSINLFAFALFAFVLLAHHFFEIFHSRQCKRIGQEGRS